MTEPSRAVFLSYASQDAEAARRICEALRAANIEVWFDQSELRGGDAWDQKIRREIRDCALFVPIISAHTQARTEGYFRLEWHLADQRKLLMTKSRPFLVPVCIDDTPDSEAEVPDSFAAAQWTRLPAGETPPAFVTRISQLLSPSEVQAQAESRPTSGSAPLGRSTTPTSTVSRWPRLVALLIAAIALLAGGYFAVDRWVLSKHSVASIPGAPTPSTIPEKSIAVLPFVDMSEKKDQEYFGDGMAEEILNVLAKIPELHVIGRTSSFQFKGKADDLRKIGTTLGAANVVEGSVRRSGDRMRVTAQLIETQDGSHRWSNTYDAKTDDVLEVQEAIATAISRALQLTVTANFAQDRSIASREAYELYLRGLHALDSGSKEGCEQAIELFSQVLRLEPNSKRALISLAWAHDCMGWGDWRVPGAGLLQARDFALRTLQVDPQSAEAHLILADVYMEHEYDWTAAQHEVDVAFQLAAPDARALRTAARLAGALGQFDRSLELLTQALARDPLDPSIYDQLGDTHARAGKFDTSEEMYKRCLQIAPNFVLGHFYVANALMLQGRLAEALEEVGRESDEIARYAGRALVFHALSRQADSDAALKRFIETTGTQWLSEVARVYAFRGERDQALAWLEKAYEARDVDLYFIKGDPLLKNLEGDPRYKAFLRKMNLPE